MKKKISITIDKEKLEAIEKLLEDKMFRNRSHVIEYGVGKFLDEDKLEEER